MYNLEELIQFVGLYSNKMKAKTLKFFMVLISAGIITACGSSQAKKEDKYFAMTGQDLLAEGDKNLEGASYEVAVQHYEAIEARFPHTSLAEQAKLNKIYAHYHDRQHAKALTEIQEFIRLYPNHESVDYLYYMQGLINFDRARSILDKLLPPDRSKVDQNQMRDSLESFMIVVNRYPDGQYAEDAAKRIVYLRNLLAEAEIHKAEFYMERHAYIGAINRAQYVLDNYDATTSISNALYIQAKAYGKLNLPELAEKSVSVLRHNFPYDARLPEFGFSNTPNVPATVVEEVDIAQE